jgi:IS5 family transposase
MFKESDDRVVERFLENPYWQHFCGNEYFQHKLPCHPTSLVRWRRHIGVKGAEAMVKETLDAAMESKALKESDVEHVNIDTTVQPKNVAPPTDAKLYHRAREVLVKAAKKARIALRQTYTHLSKKTLFNHIRVKHRKN